jgi:Helix-turn-helix domain
MERTLTLEQVCEYMKIKVRTGRNRLSRGGPMPPGHRRAGTRRWIFFASEVEAWLREPVEDEPRPGRRRAADEHSPARIGSMVLQQTRRGRPRSKVGSATDVRDVARGDR